MQNGIIKKYYKDQSYGFIIDEDEEEYFFHIGDLHAKSRNRRIMEGQNVEFDIKSDMKGDKAVNIRIK